MDQGQALSVLARAYLVSNDERYLKAGDLALEYLIRPVSEGGVMDTLEDLDVSLKDNIIFEEYISEPASYTLNGFMFTLLGLYDWSEIEAYRGKENNVSNEYFKKGILTLKKILPYYDIGGFTAYDLGYITHKVKPHVGVGYHAVHIYLLHALYTVTSDESLHEYEQLWASYVNE